MVAGHTWKPNHRARRIHRPSCVWDSRVRICLFPDTWLPDLMKFRWKIRVTCHVKPVLWHVTSQVCKICKITESFPSALVAGSQRGYLNHKSTITLPFDLNRNPFRSLIRGIHGSIITIQMKYKREFSTLYIKFAWPCTGRASVWNTDSIITANKVKIRLISFYIYVKLRIYN